MALNMILTSIFRGLNTVENEINNKRSIDHNNLIRQWRSGSQRRNVYVNKPYLPCPSYFHLPLDYFLVHKTR